MGLRGLMKLRDEEAPASPSNALMVYGSNKIQVPFKIPPCSTCEHRVKMSEECGHPAVGAWEINWLTGKPTLRQGQAISITRTTQGECGPEGKLYQRQTVKKSPIPYQIGSAVCLATFGFGSLMLSWWFLFAILPAVVFFAIGEDQK